MEGVNFFNRFSAKTPEVEYPFRPATLPSKAVGEPAASVLTQRKAGMSGVSESPNLSTQLDIGRIQSALRAAERGETWLLYNIYRDMLLGCSHLQAEWSKRKMVVLGQPQSIVPHDMDNADDVKAAIAIEEMIENCDNWYDGLDHLLDATLYPLSAAEKIFQAIGPSDELTGNYTIPVRYRLKEISPINYSLICSRIPYQCTQATEGVLAFDPNDWEANIRFFRVEPQSGRIDWSTADVYKPSQSDHIIHRGNFLSKTIRDNYGGQMRAILFWWFLGTQGRDWLAIYMQKYGTPFLVGKVDVNNADMVAMLEGAFQMSQQIGGVVVDSKAAVEAIQVSASDGANAHKTLIGLCNSEISKIVLGQELSSTAKNTGLGSGMADFHGEVREDFRMFDTRKLADTLSKQLFTPYLRLNGLRGRAPTIHWGSQRAGESLVTAQTIESLYAGGIRPTDMGMRTINDRLGFELEKFDPNPPKPEGDKQPAKKD